MTENIQPIIHGSVSKILKFEKYYSSKRHELEVIAARDKSIKRVQQSLISDYQRETKQIKNEVYKRSDFIELLKKLKNLAPNISLNQLENNINKINPLHPHFCQSSSILFEDLVDKENFNKFFEILYQIYEILVKNAFFEKYKICNDYESLAILLTQFEKPFEVKYISFSHQSKFIILVNSLKRYSFEKNLLFKESFKQNLNYFFEQKLHNEFKQLYLWSKHLLDYKDLVYGLFCFKIGKLFENGIFNYQLDEHEYNTATVFQELFKDLTYYTNNILDQENSQQIIDKIREFISLQKFKERCINSYSVCMDEDQKQKKVLAELQVFFEQHNEYIFLFANNLKETITKKLSFTTDSKKKTSTTEVIFIYIKLLKAMKNLGSQSNLIKHFIFPLLIDNISTRHDAASVICLSVFDANIAVMLNSNNVLTKDQPINMQFLQRIKEECFPENNNQHTHLNNKQSFNGWFEKTYLNWKPEPIKEDLRHIKSECVSFSEFLDKLPHISTYDKFKDQEKSTFHYLVMTIFPQNKEEILKEFVKASRWLFLDSNFQHKEFWRWEHAMKSISNLVSYEDLFSSDNESPTSSLFNTLQIMVNDYYDIYRNENDTLLTLSSGYWVGDIDTEYYNIKEIFNTKYHNDEYSRILEILKIYAANNIGQQVSLLYTHCYMFVSLTFDDERSFYKKVPFLNGILINFIAGLATEIEFDIPMIRNQVPFSLLSDTVIEKSLEYWVHQQVLYKNKLNKYYVIENLSQHLAALINTNTSDISLKSNFLSTKSELISDTNDLLLKYKIKKDTHSYLKPLITGLISNKKHQLSFNNIQAWVNLSTSSNSIYLLSSAELENYLNFLIESGILCQNSRGFYRLSTKK
ncbi:hypothetical protein QEN19_001913 [Hanseniaspora menglaensis]